MSEDLFERKLPGRRIDPLYVLALAFVAMAMLLLPLAYVGLVVGLGWAVVHHAATSVHFFDDGPRSVYLALFLYVLPIVGGAIAVLFMLKPLFAPKPRRERGQVLLENQEPELYAFVGQLADAIGAPRPRRIEVDSTPNASASFRGGPLALVKLDLVLTIGLPLAAVYDVRQLAAVLAHELGHFSQRIGLRLSFIIEWVNHWFARMVFERDAWDEALVRATDENRHDEIGSLVALPALLARMIIGLTRVVLFAFLILGHMLSCGLMRRLEYDADRLSAQVSGGDTMSEALHHLPRFEHVAPRLSETLERGRLEGRLVDDVPALTAYLVESLSKAERLEVKKEALAGKTALFDTHPSLRDRTLALRRSRERGALRRNGPASELFRDFATLSKTVTTNRYRAVLGADLGRCRLVPSSEMIARSTQAETAKLALERMYQGLYSAYRPFTLARIGAERPAPPPAPPPAGDDASSAIAAARSAMEAALPACRDQLHGLAARNVEQMRASGTPIDPLDDRAIDGTVVHVFEERARARIRTALAHADGPDLRARADTVRGALAVLEARLVEVLSMRHDWQELVAHFGKLEANPNHPLAGMRIREGLPRLAGRLEKLRAELDGHPYPYEHERDGMSLARYVVESPPSRATDPNEVMNATSRAFHHFLSLHQRLMADLADIVEQVEGAHGHQPWPMPDAPSAAA